MSNLKRPTPDQRGAILKKLQEISSTRLEAEKSHECPLLPSHLIMDRSHETIEASLASGACESKKFLPAKEDHSSSESKCDNVPDLTITTTLENEKSSRSVWSESKMISSANSSPGSRPRKQHGNKGLDTLSASPSSDLLSPQPPSPRLRMVPGYSPKLCRRFDYWPDSGAVSSSPTSPSRKYFKLLSAPATFAGGLRRGSEPFLDAVSDRDFNEIQMSMTDRRWEKLRSILVAMKNEPFDVNSVLESTSPDVSTSLKENIDTQQELSALRKEISTLRTEMELMDSKLHQSIKERNAALSYIRKMKLDENIMKDANKNYLTLKDESIGCLDLNHNEESDRETDGIGVKNSSSSSIYTKELDKLRQESSTKDDVMATLERVLEELSVERSYLDHLMSIVLDRAPWMLDEVDREGHWTEVTNDSEGKDSDVATNLSDDEVWC